jgi:hypothetical protein
MAMALRHPAPPAAAPMPAVSPLDSFNDNQKPLDLLYINTTAQGTNSSGQTTKHRASAGMGKLFPDNATLLRLAPTACVKHVLYCAMVSAHTVSCIIILIYVCRVLT